jgi:hypothetical protein
LPRRRIRIPETSPQLAVYLNDHLAGATGGIELARRLRASNEGDPVFSGPVAAICAEIEAEREDLLALMGRLGIRRSPVKPAGAWLAEKLGRLKLNGQLRGYSPLSRMIELEGLCIGITGKLQMWRALAGNLGEERAQLDFAALAERAERQRRTVEELHAKAAERVLLGR